MTGDKPRGRVSHERIAVDALVRSLAGLEQIQLFRGQASDNRFPVLGWGLTVLQQFQFGDLRVEAPNSTIVVEFESAGGVANLVKYWPLLSGHWPKRFVIVHVFQIGSDFDYIAHRRLWEFLRDRMRDDLALQGILSPEVWEARLFTYQLGGEAAEAAAFVRSACL